MICQIRTGLLYCCIAFCAITHSVYAQETDSIQVEEKPAAIEVHGYMKNLQTWLFFNTPPGTFLQDNLLHQRTNVRWTISPKFTWHTALRTRVFFGDLVRANPNYAAQIDNANNDVFDLSTVLLNRNAWVAQTMLDRFYLEYAGGNWEVRLGRQRINWGINTVWNPNDVFNAFAFTDFDYEERPGSDALRVRYFTGVASCIEVAVKASKQPEDAVAALLWKFNALQFDGQLLAGYAHEDLFFGTGWAGNIGNAGLKGEATYFLPSKSTGQHAFAATASIDYAFSNSLYVQTGYLYNSLGTFGGNIQDLFGFRLSAKNLYPFRHALFFQTGYPVTPLINAGLALIYSPVTARALFLNPTCTVSMAANWDLDLVGQIVANRTSGKQFESPIQAVFIRTKYSF